MAEGEGVIYPDFGGQTTSGGEPPTGAEMFLRFVDAKIEASEHRTMSTVLSIRSELQNLVNAKSSRADVWGGTAVIVATFLAIFGIWVAAFDSGAQLQGTVSDKVEEIQDLAESNARSIEGLASSISERDQRLDAVLQALEAQRDRPQASPQEGQN